MDPTDINTDPKTYQGLSFPEVCSRVEHDLRKEHRGMGEVEFTDLLATRIDYLLNAGIVTE